MSETNSMNMEDSYLQEKYESLDEKDLELKKEVKGLDSNDDEKTFILRLEGSSDISITKDLMEISKVIKIAIENSTDEIPIMPLSTSIITGHQLELIVEYMNLCKKYNSSKDITAPPAPLKSKDLTDCAGEGLPKEIVDFVNGIRDNHGGLNMVYGLINTCNYLDIHGLMHLLCAYIAAQMKGLPMETVEKVLDPNDPTNGDEK